MQNIGITEIISATQGKLLSGSMDVAISGISTDSRNIKERCLFIPLSGERFDGHNFLNTAFEAGAAAALTHKCDMSYEGKCLIAVNDTSKALRDIAAYYRQKFQIPFVGITGSVGKTSTKDMIASVLKRSYNVLKTEGNLNNEIGVPLTIFNLDENHQTAVLEMGMSGFGEISRLTAIIKPDVAVITNVGMAHIEKLGSRQNILKAKMEILEGLDPKGLLVLNGDDAMLSGMKDLLKFRTALYGIDDGVDYKADNINSYGENGTFFNIKLAGNDYSVHVPVPGVHNVQNALAAIAVGIELGISIDEIIIGIKEYIPSKMRMDILTVNGIKILNDTYNASPQSMEAAIDVLREVGGGNRKIAVLGDMLELGDWSLDAHYNVGKFAAKAGIDKIISVGLYAESVIQGARDASCAKENTMFFGNNHEVLEYLKSIVSPEDRILIKGSRGMRMEEIVKGLST